MSQTGPATIPGSTIHNTVAALRTRIEAQRTVSAGRLAVIHCRTVKPMLDRTKDNAGTDNRQVIEIAALSETETAALPEIEIAAPQPTGRNKRRVANE